MARFVGIDLSWTGLKESGVCVWDTRDGDVCCERLEASTVSPTELMALCERGDEDTVVVAVDAPLIVTEERSVERDIGRAFGRYKAAAHSGSLELLQRTGRMAGPELADGLARRGFGLDPTGLLAGEPGRYALEAYPHAAHVRLFGLRERIRYKRKRGRSVSDVREGLADLQRLLIELLTDVVPGVLQHPSIRAALNPGAVEARGRELKRLEDALDGLMCAYVAWHAWRFGAAGTEVFGDRRRGCICVPREVGEGATFARGQTCP